MSNHLCQTLKDLFLCGITCVFSISTGQVFLHYWVMFCYLLQYGQKVPFILRLLWLTMASLGNILCSSKQENICHSFYVVSILFYSFLVVFIHWFQQRCITLSSPFVVRPCQHGIYMVLWFGMHCKPIILIECLFPVCKTRAWSEGRLRGRREWKMSAYKTMGWVLPLWIFYPWIFLYHAELNALLFFSLAVF